MRRKIINAAFISTLFLSFFVACTAPIEIETKNSKPVLVVYGCLTDEYKHQQVRLTSSSPYFEEKTNLSVTDAAVTVTCSEGNEYEFIYWEDGYYRSESEFAAIPGVTYSLNIDFDFDKDGAMENYRAETFMNPVVPLDSIVVKNLQIIGYRYYSLNIYMQDPAEFQNNYLFRFFINDSISNSKISESIITDDLLFNGAYRNGTTIEYLGDGTDEGLVERNENEDRETFFIYPGDKIRLQVFNIEAGYYDFIEQCISEKGGENPFFGGPPSNITTNISNGAVGYFSSYGISEKKTIAP